jgi:2-polyprenyl-3-methyl-5-hydroxy-6-metoxy-1,4-benzoquinol methylase/Tfp pilus assembly protein PilF
VPAPINDTFEHALRLHGAGSLSEAETICQGLIASQPGHVDALNLLGIIAGQRGALQTSADYFRRALVQAPRNGIILSNLAETLRLQHRTAEAIPLLYQAVALAPEVGDNHLKLAVALMDAGRIGEALQTCRAALSSFPEDPNLNSLSAEILMTRNPAEAAPHLFKALEHAPDSARHWEQLGRLLFMAPLPPTQTARFWLLKALGHPAIRPTAVSGSIAQTLCLDPAIASLVNEAGQGLPSGRALTAVLERLASDELLVALMEIAVVPSASLERLFTGLRKALLLGMAGVEPTPGAIRFCAALAVQAYFTDYAWFVTDEEQAAIDALSIRLQETLRLGVPADGRESSLPLWLSIVGAYRALHRLDGASRLARWAWSDALAPLIRIQITEPLEERSLRDQIPRLTPISDEVSKKVRAQYEENPYPHWVRAGRAPGPMALRDFMADINAAIPSDPSFARPDVLIAGCGTGQQSVFAASFYKDATILAIDLSLASLSYAIRKSRELGFHQIDYRQADILELAGLQRSFHVIECAGVLHHMADPMAGWRILVDRLRPGGLMRVALYSESARRFVVKARRHIAESGYTDSVEDIRRYRRYLLELPADHPLAILRMNARDLFNLSECRDLLFHVQEHRFTVPQIQHALDRLGLRFLGFRSLPNTDAYRLRFPHDPEMTSLENWDAFEREFPDTFVAMYNFWAQKV